MPDIVSKSVSRRVDASKAPRHCERLRSSPCCSSPLTVPAYGSHSTVSATACDGVNTGDRQSAGATPPHVRPMGCDGARYGRVMAPNPRAPDRNLAMELVRVTEAAAMAAGRWMGRGDKEGADGAAVSAMRIVLQTVSMDGVVVIGEGEKDNAP